MAGPSNQEKTESPTDHKLREARRRGEVAVSRDVNAALSLLAVCGALAFVIGSVAKAIKTISEFNFNNAAKLAESPHGVLPILTAEVNRIGMVVAPVFFVAFVAALLTPLLQIGPLITFDPLKPKLERLNPVEGTRRLFFTIRTYIELLKSTFKVVVIAAACGSAIYEYVHAITAIPDAAPIDILRLLYEIIKTCLLRSAAVLAAIALFDLVHQRWQFHRDQRMTKDEVKREHKQQEGDPEHRQARKRLHEEIAQDQMILDVPKADVILTNPTHIAVALRFDPDLENAPRLLARGQDLLAEKIKQIARDEDIPILQNVSLARAIHELELSTEIPPELYEAAVHVLQWVEEVLEERGERAKWSLDESDDHGDP